MEAHHQQQGDRALNALNVHCSIGPLHNCTAGNQADLDKLALSGNLKFSDMFEVAEPVGSPPKCPPGFSPTNTASPIYKHTDKSTFASYAMECLKVTLGGVAPLQLTYADTHACGRHAALESSLV